MVDEVTLRAVLDILPEEIVLVGPDHVIRYMNRFAKEQYAKEGGEALVGRSIFDCHNERSCALIREAWARLVAGEDETLMSENEKRRLYLRAVRDPQGRLLGYYEWYERLTPRGQPPASPEGGPKAL